MKKKVSVILINILACGLAFADGDYSFDELVSKVHELQSKVIIEKQKVVSNSNPKTANYVGSSTVYDFKEGQLYELYTSKGRVSDIVLEAGESLSSSPVAGDTLRWKLSTHTTGKGNQRKTHIVVKPTEEGIETNLIIPTDKRAYHVKMISGDWYMPKLSWNYEQSKLSVPKSNEIMGLSLSELNFEYTLTGGDYIWKPLRVFDDGEKTYLQMSTELGSREAPVFFVLSEDEEPFLVNYRVKGSYYIVDRLFDYGELRVGQTRRVNIYRSGFEPSLFSRLFE